MTISVHSDEVMPTDVVEVLSTLIPAIDQQLTVRFMHQNTLCAVEELILTQAKELGWYER